MDTLLILSLVALVLVAAFVVGGLVYRKNAARLRKLESDLREAADKLKK